MARVRISDHRAPIAGLHRAGDLTPDVAQRRRSDHRRSRPTRVADAWTRCLATTSARRSTSSTATASISIDADGKRYLDFVSGIAVNALGYGDPGLRAACTPRPTA